MNLTTHSFPELLIIKDAADNKEEGCLTYRVNQKLNDKNTFIMFEEASGTDCPCGRPVNTDQVFDEQYKDEAAIEAHKAAPEFQGLATKAKDWLAEPFVIDLLQPSKL